jgi:protein involved in polysaccharide export with SLBB domain
MTNTRFARIVFGLPATALLLLGCSHQRQSSGYFVETLDGRREGPFAAQGATALDGLLSACGPELRFVERAELQRVEADGPASYTIDVQAIVERGDGSSNLALRSGDVLRVHPGAVAPAKALRPQIVATDWTVVDPPFGDAITESRERKTAFDAIVEAFGSASSAAEAGVTAVRVQRKSEHGPELMLVDLQALWTRGDSSENIMLQPGDRIAFLSRRDILSKSAARPVR